MAHGVLLGVKGSSLAGGRDTRVTHQFLDSEELAVLHCMRFLLSPPQKGEIQGYVTTYHDDTM